MTTAEQLKPQLDLLEVVSHYVRLKPNGSRHVGLCPFHEEKTPSFGVHRQGQFYKCFGCDARGDAFNFTQRIEDIGFPEAVRLLADRYNIQINSESSGTRRQRFASADLATAELFRVGFCWAIERYLDALKELWLLDETAMTTCSIRDATRLLETAKSWTPWQAARFLKRFRRRQFVGHCIAEAREAQNGLVRAITSSEEATAAAA